MYLSTCMQKNLCRTFIRNLQKSNHSESQKYKFVLRNLLRLISAEFRQQLQTLLQSAQITIAINFDKPSIILLFRFLKTSKYYKLTSSTTIEGDRQSKSSSHDISNPPKIISRFVPLFTNLSLADVCRSSYIVS